MKCLAQDVAEKSRGQDFQGQGHCGKVKVQRIVTLAHPLMKMSLYTEYEMLLLSNHADNIFRVKVSVARSKCDEM